MGTAIVVYVKNCNNLERAYGLSLYLCLSTFDHIRNMYKKRALIPKIEGYKKNIFNKYN